LAELILHHYPTSPYSEKIRLMLGAKRIPWRSVIIPTIMPKPDVVALTGGYRKTPIAQLGADIYCDTARIADLLETLAPEPPLYPREHAAASRAAARWSDAVVFQAAVALMFQPSVMQQNFGDRGAGGPDLRAFIEDRMAMVRSATVRRPSVPEARALVSGLLRDIDVQVGDGRPFLHGAAPAIADYAFYHSLWFLERSPQVNSILSGHKHFERWMGHMRALGHGSSSEIASGEAVEIARSSTPAPLAATSDAEGFAPGDRVEVLPTDYGLDPSAGELVACTPDEIAVRRVDPRAGELIVHFPRASYDLRKPA
jgi:glutathione S-transferase